MVQTSTRHEVAKSTIDPEKLDALVSLVHTANAVNRFLDIEFQNYGISRAKLLVMKLLVARGGKATPTALSGELFRSKHTITALVDGLEKAGFVQRDRHGGDRRSIDVALTNKGWEFLKSTLPICQEIGYTVMSHIDTNEARQLKALLDKIRQPMT